MSYVLIKADPSLGTPEIAIRPYRNGKIKVYALNGDALAKNEFSVIALDDEVYSLGKGSDTGFTVYASAYKSIRHRVGVNIGTRRHYHASQIINAEFNHLPAKLVTVLTAMGIVEKSEAISRFIYEHEWVAAFQESYNHLVKYADELRRTGVISLEQRRVIDLISIEKAQSGSEVNRVIYPQNVSFDKITSLRDLIFVQPKLREFNENDSHNDEEDDDV